MIKRLQRFFWFAVHNLVAHPLLITRADWADLFHDWTADRIDAPDAEDPKELSLNERWAKAYAQMAAVGLIVCVYYWLFNDIATSRHFGILTMLFLILSHIKQSDNDRS
jgi:hypothetical protein